MADTYEGPVCYVGHDHEAVDGRQLEAGWHYTVIPATTPDGKPIPHRPDESPQTMPGEKLHLSEKTGKYRLATDKDKSWHSRFHQRLVTVAVDGNLAEIRTDEERDAAYRHLDALEKRLKKSGAGLDPHEHDHMLRTIEDVAYMRRQLERRKA